MASELAATKGELAATRTELGQEVEELRKVLNATLQDKTNLAANCCALEAQVRIRLQIGLSCLEEVER